MSKKIGVMLSGCGVFDGAEIHESVLTLLAIAEAGASYDCIAPTIDQAHTWQHADNAVAESDRRQVHVEAARIARGDLVRLDKVNIADYAAMVFPGGFGVAKNFCDYAFRGADMAIQPEIEAVIRAFHAAGKPLGFLCIAPILAGKIFGPEQVRVTIGNDPTTAGHIASWGAQHVVASVREVVADERLKIFSSPAYMLATSITEVRDSCRNLVNAVLGVC